MLLCRHASFAYFCSLLCSLAPSTLPNPLSHSNAFNSYTPVLGDKKIGYPGE